MRYTRHLRLFVAGLAAALTLIGLSPVGAASANISHSYQATGSIPNGSIVSLDPKNPGAVLLANTSNGPQVVGVALPSKDSLLAVDAGSGNVQVAFNGTVNTLVSTVNGDIKLGDQISVSPFDGIGMESMTGVHVIGDAQVAFNSKSPGATSETVKDKSGQTHQIEVGIIPLSISVGSSNDNASSGGPKVNSLQKLVKTLSGHTISTARIVLSIVITFVALVALVTLIYASVYGSIISIGRNPLAQRAVLHTLRWAMFAAALTTIIAGLAVYFLLH